MADAFLRCVYHGCIAGPDAGIDRRPYHKNCSCALHDRDNRRCSHSLSKHKSVSYPIRRAWSEGCLAMVAASAASGVSSPSSPSMDQVESLGSYKR
uniref:SWIM-type domain-containing protein n=1 Tax=Cucumis melo TaxID=3656 RepID=A0A1S3B9X6_CUCME